jgi:hypothetical protein
MSPFSSLLRLLLAYFKSLPYLPVPPCLERVFDAAR